MNSQAWLWRIASLALVPAVFSLAPGPLLAESTAFKVQRVDYTTGYEPSSVAVDDLNNDNIPDLAVANHGSDTVSILLGAGAGVFGAAVNYAAGDGPSSVDIGDFDGDGAPDLAVTNYSGWDVSILKGNGDGTFLPAVSVSVYISPTSVVIADFDGDGDPDLAVANFGQGSYDDVVSIHLGQGDGTFLPADSFTADQRPHSIAIEDFDGDGALDLAVANSYPHQGSTRVLNYTISVLLGHGDGSFGSAVHYIVGTHPSSPCSVAAADFNGDGAPDLVVVEGEGSRISVLQGFGNGTFGSASPYDAGSIPRSVATGDLDGDGTMDLAVTDRVEHTVSIRPGVGDGTFDPAIPLAVGNTPQAVVIADLDGVGLPDLAVTNEVDHTVSVLLNLTEPGNHRTLAAGFKCLPGSGVLPLKVRMQVELINNYLGLTRRIAGRIDVRLASGTFFSNWRSGYTNVGPGLAYTSDWVQTLPEVGTLVGGNIFTLVGEDVTPLPYNQPPHPPSGDRAGAACIVTGVAP